MRERQPVFHLAGREGIGCLFYFLIDIICVENV